MTESARGRLRRQVAVLMGLCFAVASLAGSAGDDPSQGRSSTVRQRNLTVLQMNLCNSGAAGCYTGRAVAQAAGVIRAEKPDVVTLNEICDRDVPDLAQALTAAHRGGTVLSAFEPAFSLRTGQAVRCDNGQQFGVGLLIFVVRENPRYREEGGRYPMQSRGEQRAWLCLYVTATVHACATHLALGGTNGVSLAQCRYLLGTAIPAMRGEEEPLPTVVGGDLNLGAADALPCVPPSYSHTDDGAVQEVMASAGMVVGSIRTIDMRGATDHPGLIVALRG